MAADLEENKSEKTHEYFLIGEITFDKILDLMKNISANVKPHDQVILYLNSGGGNVSASNSFVQYINCKKINLNVVVFCHADSAAIQIVSAGKIRSASKYAEFIFHPIFYNVQNEKIDKNKLRFNSEDVERDEETVMKLIQKNTGIGLDVLKKLYDHGETAVTAQEALEMNLITEIWDEDLKAEDNKNNQ